MTLKLDDAFEAEIKATCGDQILTSRLIPVFMVTTQAEQLQRGS